MNITFLIGNGFDLNLKLKTSYSDFYKYYIKNDPNDLLSNSIKKDYKLWSDLEIGLGAFLKNIDENQIDEFLDSKSTLEKMLSDYLSLESCRISFKNEKALAEEFRSKIINFFSAFNTIEQGNYSQLIEETRTSIYYNFITFNYTYVLDKIIDITQKLYNPFSAHSSINARYTDYLLSPHHIHGYLTEDLILGLDNTEQILNDKLKNNPNLTNYIIKSDVNNALGEKKIEKAKDIIDKSKYICLFGLSLGDTDEMWWRYILDWLKHEKNNRLVWFINTEKNAIFSGQEKIRFRNINRKTILERCHCDVDETLELVQDKIIITNSKLFSFKNILLEDQYNEKE